MSVGVRRTTAETPNTNYPNEEPTQTPTTGRRCAVHYSVWCTFSAQLAFSLRLYILNINYYSDLFCSKVKFKIYLILFAISVISSHLVSLCCFGFGAFATNNLSGLKPIERIFTNIEPIEWTNNYAGLEALINRLFYACCCWWWFRWYDKVSSV